MATYKIYDTNAGFIQFEGEAKDANEAVRAFIEDVVGSDSVIEALEIRVVEVLADGSEIEVSWDANQI